MTHVDGDPDKERQAGADRIKELETLLGETIGNLESLSEQNEIVLRRAKKFFDGYK